MVQPLETIPAGVRDFLDLADTPASYVGQANRYARVNAGATGLEFHDLLNVANTWAALQTFNAGIQLAAGQSVRDSGGAARYLPAALTPHSTLLGDTRVTGSMGVGTLGAPLAPFHLRTAGVQRFRVETTAARAASNQGFAFWDAAGAAFSLAEVLGDFWLYDDIVGAAIIKASSALNIRLLQSVIIGSDTLPQAKFHVVDNAPATRLRLQSTLARAAVNQGFSFWDAAGRAWSFGELQGNFFVYDDINARLVFQCTSVGGAIRCIRPTLIGANADPVGGAVLELQSTTGALLLPRMTTVQRNALAAVDGMGIYNTTTTQFEKRQAGAWVAW